MAGSKFRGFIKKKPKVEEATPISADISETELVGLLNSLNEPEVVEIEVASVEVVKPVVKVTVADINVKHKAYNVFFDSAKRKYMLVTIQYNPATKDSEVVSIEPLADSQPTAIFKLNNIFALKIARAEEKI